MSSSAAPARARQTFVTSIDQPRQVIKFPCFVVNDISTPEGTIIIFRQEDQFGSLQRYVPVAPASVNLKLYRSQIGDVVAADQRRIAANKAMTSITHVACLLPAAPPPKERKRK